jgi:hypothetical protein
VASPDAALAANCQNERYALVGPIILGSRVRAPPALRYEPPDEGRFHSPGAGIWRTVEDTLGHMWDTEDALYASSAGERPGQGTVPPTPVGLRPVDLDAAANEIL